MSYIYLATPYSHSDPAVMDERYEIAAKHTAYMIQQGQHVYSPIVHCHELAKKFSLPRHVTFWRSFNIAMLRPAEKVIVLTMDGWAVSRGVRAEIHLADVMNIPLRYHKPEVPENECER